MKAGDPIWYYATRTAGEGAAARWPAEFVRLYAAGFVTIKVHFETGAPAQRIVSAQTIAIREVKSDDRINGRSVL